MAIEELKNKLQQAAGLLREAVDISARLRCQDSFSKDVGEIWEAFLRDFWSYVRLKSRECGQNLLAGISFWRISK
ncbi:MAG: hypothetical protein ACUVTU_01730 [Desulfurispora sp.]|uniref:hypothetical protein n=1 Tax=Desulfurispora sp. TaxID=3014275 RepID=UPI00404A3DB0